MTPAQYKEKFDVGFLMSEQSRCHVSEGLRRRPRRSRKVKPGRYEPRTRDRIIADLRAYARERPQITPKKLEETHPGIVGQIIALFGTYTAGVRAAGLGEKLCRRWSKEKVIEKIKKRRADGATLNAASVKKADSQLYGAACKRFVCWGKALKAAGVHPSSVSRVRDRSKKAVATDLRSWARKHGPLNSKALLASDAMLATSACRWYGSVENAAGKLRLPFYSPRKSRWTRKEVISGIRTRRTKNLTLRPSRVLREDRKLHRAACKLFGSWRKAVSAAGINYNKAIRRMDKEDVMKGLRARHRRKRSLRPKKVSEEDPSLFSAGVWQFGSWPRAVEAAGVDYRTVVPARWIPSIILREIRKRKRKGLPLTYKGVRNEDYRLLTGACNHFRSWGRALAAAGIDPQKVMPGRTHHRLIRR